MLVESMMSCTSIAYYLLQLRRNQYKSPQELEEIQWKKLKNIVHYAYDYIPYYRSLFKSVDFKPGHLRNMGDLEKIPITTKKDIRNNYSNIILRKIEKSIYDVSYTSGSNGIPLKVVSDKKCSYYSIATVAYSSNECGLGFRDKIVTIGRYRQHPRYIPKQIPMSIKSESGELNKIITNLNKIKPEAIYTTPWILNSLCTLDISRIEPKIIFSHSGTLTQHTRALVDSKFGIEINDTYASVEFNRMAFECNEHSGYHVITDSLLMEFLDKGEPVSPGERGEIVVTGLNNYAMPLIRYELGDLGIPTDEKCSCGRNWPLIRSIEGRLMDIFTLDSGRKIYPDFLLHHLIKSIRNNISLVSEFQIVQERTNKIILRFVKGKMFDINKIKNLKEDIERDFKYLGEDITLEIKIVEKIPLERSGKKKLFKSLVR